MVNNLKQKKILIIDDEVSITEELDLILDSEGYKTAIAHTGSAAITLFKDKGNKIDLILLDIKLPGMDGVEIYSELKKINPNIPVIIITGSFTKTRAEKIIKAGGKAVLYKPFSAEELLSLIKKYLITK